MLFVIHCTDKKDRLHVRMDNRPAHIDYLKSFGEKLHAAGPTLSDDGTMNGSVIILELEKAGLFSGVTISVWKKVLP